MQLFNSINSNMMLFVKKNEYILNISLDKYILLSEAIVNNLQSIRDVSVLSSRFDTLTFLSASGVHIQFINVLAYDHSIELIYTGAGTCFSSLDR